MKVTVELEPGDLEAYARHVLQSWKDNKGEERTTLGAALNCGHIQAFSAFERAVKAAWPEIDRRVGDAFEAVYGRRKM